MLSNGQEFLDTLFVSSLLTLTQMFSYLSIFLIIGFAIAKMEEKRNRWIRASVGVKGIYTTALIGVPIHELGHAIMCLVFGHHVDKIKFVQFGDPHGTMGYVNHSYDPKNLVHRIGMFFIGVAPIMMGIFSITVAYRLLLPESFELWWGKITKSDTAMESLLATFSVVPSLFTGDNLSSLSLYLFLGFSIAVASHMTLSPPDIKGARSGLFFIFVIGTLINMFYVPHMYDVKVSDLFINDYNLFIYSVSLIALLFSGVATGIAFILYTIRNVVKGTPQ